MTTLLREAQTRYVRASSAVCRADREFGFGATDSQLAELDAAAKEYRAAVQAAAGNETEERHI